MDENTLGTVKLAFKEHYFKHHERVEIPIRISEREFGYVPFGGSMIRHLTFKSAGELIATMVREAPRGAYYSCGYYHDPSLPMAEKGWKGGDLIFDIDADDLNAPCKAVHDRWSCKQCGKLGQGLRPEECPACGNNRIAQMNWACELCLGAAKVELVKLMEILTDDFGITSKNLRPYFSGNIGYHLNVEETIIEELDQQSRVEIANYVSGKGLLLSTIGIGRQSSYESLASALPLETESGWRGRIARYFTQYRSKDHVDSTAGDVRSKTAHIYRRLGYSKFEKLMEQVAKAAGSVIDAGVTTDVHRIFRLPGSLHGETGLEKVRIAKLSEFDPSVHPVVLGDEKMKIHVQHSPPLTLRGETYGPYRQQVVTLPQAAAVYLLCRGLARADSDGH